MKNQDLISVIIPVYNGKRYLAEAIESVLSQTYRPIEVIVVDDGSGDGSAAIIQRIIHKYGELIRYRYQPNAGVGQARNRGVELALGEFLAFLDQDDLWLPNKLTSQIEALTNALSLDIVFGHVDHFYSPELDANVRERLQHPGRTMPGYHQGAMLIRRDTFNRVGPFKTNGQFGHFLDWYTRAQDQKLVIEMRPEVVMLRRIHAANTSTKERENRSEYAQVLGQVLRRRRKTEQQVGKPSG